ncbi:MAG TPA: DUF2007 domain-containing protein [Candidatus Paceibacterota bacterium]
MKTSIYTAPSEIDAHLTKGYLEQYGIKVVINSDFNAVSLFGHPTPAHFNTYAYHLYVSDADFEKAQQILAERDAYHSSSQE